MLVKAGTDGNVEVEEGAGEGDRCPGNGIGSVIERWFRIRGSGAWVVVVVVVAGIRTMLVDFVRVTMSGVRRGSRKNYEEVRINYSVHVIPFPCKSITRGVGNGSFVMPSAFVGPNAQIGQVADTHVNILEVPT